MKTFLSRSKRYIAAVLIAVICLSLISCGKQEEASYSSPNFTEKKDDKTEDKELSSEADASITDAILKASMSDASITDSVEAEMPASITDASVMGMYKNNMYFNTLAEFAISVDNEEWKFYDAAGVATVTGTSVDEINNLWHGYRSPHDADTTYGAIVYNTEDGSNIIVSYVNPTAYNMPEFNSEKYIKMAASRYENCTISKVSFLNQDYVCLDVKDEAEVGKRTLFAVDRDGLIVLITFTLQEETTLEEAVKLFAPLEL